MLFDILFSLSGSGKSPTASWLVLSFLPFSLVTLCRLVLRQRFLSGRALALTVDIFICRAYYRVARRYDFIVECQEKYVTLNPAFLTIFRRLPKILHHLFEGHTNVAKKSSENFQRLSKTFEFEVNLKVLPLYTNEFKYNLRNKIDIREISDICTRDQDMENTTPESRM